jgi:formylglycine-generating enzyme
MKTNARCNPTPCDDFKPQQCQICLYMKTRINTLLTILAVLAGIHQTAAQDTKFFRISGPAATYVIAFGPDGNLIWSNAQPGATYAIQTLSSFTGGTNWVNYVQIPVTSRVNTNLLCAFNPPPGMVLIPSGKFTIGDTLDGESDAIPTNVNISGYYMDSNLVSDALWESVYYWGTNAGGYSFDNYGSASGPNYPVQSLFWYDAVKWCNARSQQAGLTPVYYTNSGLTQIYTNGDVDAVFANWSANGYRLPTEAEWEKAARGGLVGLRFPWGDTISESQADYYACTSCYSYDLGPNGNNPAASANSTTPVGYFASNAYGLFDMGGNSMEWCWDWYAISGFPEPGAPYPAGSPYLGGTDPRGPSSSPFGFRVIRGGDGVGDHDAASVRCAYRFHAVPNYPAGFRCVKGL